MILDTFRSVKNRHFLGGQHIILPTNPSIVGNEQHNFKGGGLNGYYLG